MHEDHKHTIWTVCIVILVISLVLGTFWVVPQYWVYSKRLSGEADLARAVYTKRVQVQEAQGKVDASKLLAQAEVERAKGVAQANIIIGGSLKDNEAYLRYLFVNNLENSQNQIIYIPTEANLPILEATRNFKNER